MRDAYADQLDSIRTDLVSMSRLVLDAVSRSTHALLEGDAATAEAVISDDTKVDQFREDIEQKAFEILSLQAPVAGDLRMVIAAMRMVSELERMGDLSVHVAKIARLRVPEIAVPTRVEPTISRMATIAAVMVGQVERIIGDRDVEAAKALEEADEEMDKLRRTSFRELLGSDWKDGVEAAVDVALLGRYYERIADHAVSIARRVVFLVTGDMPAAV
ncbi:phosphate transport system regulatory protein PhoU [Marmoricola endophyticus]|uniref:Phosphate-specific transport system accessory protein PhoU n=1 Tax=Marmoricola endophyticus TaxID=2040280 RepID=A0A917BMN0_9ACTN|nr:phosphate signaling complex protein PhoU [Marmoricola endophyticus]GGF51974.1 phosphate transport system regulatory protein PhoU [Marmoricola endophyticus]